MVTKLEQKAAAERIMGRLGPLDAQEQQAYDQLIRTPDEYLPPDATTGERVCGTCGEVFPSLEAYVTHSSEHNPSASQWVTAHKQIQAAKERVKERAKGSGE
jgi:hypothetical protein